MRLRTPLWVLGAPESPLSCLSTFSPPITHCTFVQVLARDCNLMEFFSCPLRRAWDFLNFRASQIIGMPSLHPFLDQSLQMSADIYGVVEGLFGAWVCLIGGTLQEDSRLVSQFATSPQIKKDILVGALSDSTAGRSLPCTR